MKYGKFDVYIEDEVVGKLDIVREGLLTCFLCRAMYSSEKVLRLAADTGEEYSVIGVMMPDGDDFLLEKNMTKNDIYIKKLENAERYVLISEDAVYKNKVHTEDEEKTDERLWKVCDAPETLFEDMEAGLALRGIEGVMMAEYEGKVYIAAPIKEGKPFPPLPIFYFGQRGQINGSNYLLFTLVNGRLQI